MIDLTDFIEQNQNDDTFYKDYHTLQIYMKVS